MWSTLENLQKLTFLQPSHSTMHWKQGAAKAQHIIIEERIYLHQWQKGGGWSDTYWCTNSCRGMRWWQMKSSHVTEIWGKTTKRLWKNTKEQRNFDREVVISAYEAVTLNLRRVESTSKEYWIIEISVQAAANIPRRALRTRALTQDSVQIFIP